MAFYDEKHKEEIFKIDQLWSNLNELNQLAESYGISDIFQDNGAKVLQQLIYLNMKILPGREGNDCISEGGMEFEMKSINLETSASGFSTNHHTTYDIISKYRKVPWTFAIYHGINLTEMYVMTPQMLEPQYAHWEEKLKTMAHLNNPKIPVKFVRENGIKVYPITKDSLLDPNSISY